MSRSHPPKVRQHVHCDSCFSRRCKNRVEVSVSCAVTPCRLHCGALFHLCKEEEHLLLCPNVRVPCLNAAYGCPAHLTRSSQAAHLQVCPASVVCCSMEWLRWPVDDTNPHSNVALQENMLKENEGQAEALDFGMTLVDQTDLYARLKMKPLYPELMEKEEEDEEEIKGDKNEKAVGGLINGVITNKSTNGDLSASICENDVEETVQDGAGQALGFSREKYNMSEMMFGMERGGCAVAQANQDNPKPKEKGKTSKEEVKQESGVKKAGGDRKDTETGGASAAKNCPPPDITKTGLAPWQEGVMERLGKELTPQEYNMYVVHHGRMLVAFGQIQACTSREKDFVYGSLEPIPVQTLRSFKVPDSYHYRQRVHLYDTTARAPNETRSVDTSDLGVNEEDWFCDEAAATLLGYAEKDVMGHKISESKAADGLYVDEGTQTHSFRSAPFKGRTTLSDVVVGKPLKLHLQLQAECVNSRHNKGSCVFTFLCGHTFHRGEIATHFRNVHSDIQTCLSGWFEQRCPLAYLGCTYSQRRFQPSTHEATVTYNQELKSFNLRPLVSCLDDEFQLGSSSGDTSTQRKRGGREDSLSSLPYEVLCHMASFLDSLSLSQLALVSQLMRQVCSSLLQDRGMITLRWEKKKYSHGGAKWRAKPVWEFSRLFSSVDSWHFADIPPISAHLKVCPYYKTCLHRKRFGITVVGSDMDAGKLEQQVASVERGIAFLKHEHLAMLTDLQLEITQLKRRCHELSCELDSRFPDRTTAKEEAELAERCEAAEHLLKDQQCMMVAVRGELRAGRARASALGRSLKEEERHFLEELKRRSHKITLLSRELQCQNVTTTNLCHKLHTARLKLYQQRQSTGRMEEGGGKEEEEGEEDEEEEEDEDDEEDEGESSEWLLSPPPPASPSQSEERLSRQVSVREERVRACVPQERVTLPQRPHPMPDPALFLVPLRYRLLRWNRQVRMQDGEGLEDEWEDIEDSGVHTRVDMEAAEGETAL
ncbi:hypothetical protein LDENG_00252010 [Lucifuga dentata]|nr:hypothetical protein LDENG_00252010 [Lucifuga dentata]